MIVVFVVTVAVCAAATGLMYGLKGCRSRWLNDGDDRRDET